MGKKQVWKRRKATMPMFNACKQYEYIMENNICTSTKELAITGKDLIALGCPLGEKNR